MYGKIGGKTLGSEFGVIKYEHLANLLAKPTYLA